MDTGFSGESRGSKSAFMVVVPGRTKNTLMPIIQKYIRTGSTIMSDEWRAYADIGTSGYTHQTVNHSEIASCIILVVSSLALDNTSLYQNY